ncbi:Holliday junction branch migration protein RuvA [Halofilum ochraceum]|uniref:Holliday junction branch migration protein RuvA n=1 Tax=Halofilum ochraceum TaxID=1611323 RepID=UPI000830FC3C|nr:Holliday junction branch migration protein RuvA [Halofilum ochraceum]
MIGRLRGTLVSKQPPGLMIDVGGVGYELEAPLSTFYDLPAVGETVTLFTHHVVREDAQLLFAFARESERRLFRALLKVSGVGAKMALAVLSGMSADAFARCIETDDVTALTKLPGIGKKTAERLIVEMRDRLSDTDLRDALPAAAGQAPAADGDAPADPVNDAASALVALGYRQAEAAKMIRGIDTNGLSTEDIIRRALQAAAR